MSGSDTASMATVLNERFWGVPIETAALPVLTEHSHVLDIGCGTTDSRKNPASEKVLGSATALPIGTGVMHAVVTSELTPDNAYFNSDFETSPNQIKLMTEISRVLRAGGCWIAYNEAISRYDDWHRPPGFAVNYRMRNRVMTAPGYKSLALPFGIFEKKTEIIDPALVGRNVAMKRKHQYVDDYICALDSAYPVANVIGKKQIEALEIGDTTSLDKSAFPFRLCYPESWTRKFFIESAKAGRWKAGMVPFAYPDPEDRLAKLAEPYSNALTRSLRDSADTAVDRLLRQLLVTNKIHARVVGKRVVMLPRQEILDGFVDFRDTDIHRSGVQAKKSLRLDSI